MRLNPRTRTIVREIFVFLLFVVLAVGLTWPLVPNIDTAVADPGDPLFVVWLLNWGHWATLHSPLELFQAPIFHPARYTLAFSENLYGVSLLTLPLHLAGFGAVTIYNLAMLLGFAGCGYGAYVLGRVVTGRLSASLIAGIIFQFIPYRLEHLSHLQIIWSGWLPLLLAAFLWYRRRPSWIRAVVFGFAFLFNGLTNIHWLLFGGVAIIAAAVLSLVVDGAGSSRSWTRLGVCALVASLLLLPFLLPYKAAAETYGMKRSRGENLDASATWRDWITPTDQSETYGSLKIARTGKYERRLFPGLGPLLLLGCFFLLTKRSTVFESAETLISPSSRRTRMVLHFLDVLIVVALLVTFFVFAQGRIRWLGLTSFGIPVMIALALLVIRGAVSHGLRNFVSRSRFSFEAWCCVLWLAIGFIGSFGLNGFLHNFLFARVEAFQSVRVPARWAMIAYAGLSGLCAAGAVPLLQSSARQKVFRTLALSGLLLLELRPTPVRWYLVDPAPPPVYRWLAQLPQDTVIAEFPLNESGPSEAVYLLRHTDHHRRLVNGASGFEPPIHHFFASLARTMSPRLLFGLERVGTQLIVVHGDTVGSRHADVVKWLRRGMAEGRLRFVGRFDHEAEGDFVFALTRSTAGLPRVRAFGRQDDLQRFLNIQPTYTNQPFGYVDWPRQGSEVRGALNIWGWALSPAVVKSVNVRLQNGRVVIPAKLTIRQDVVRMFPWYPAANGGGFSLELRDRPDGVRLETDLQVEIIDRAGHVKRLRPVLFRWAAAE